MRWSDMRERPNEEARAARAMLDRVGWVVATAMVLAALLIR
ncbi:morphogenic membrane protein MmpB [Streptomyces litchfieldiae]